MDNIESLIRRMYSDAKQSRELLTEIISKDNFENIFSPGERETIQQLGRVAKFKSEMLCSAVQSIDALPKSYQKPTKKLPNHLPE